MIKKPLLIMAFFSTLAFANFSHAVLSCNTGVEFIAQVQRNALAYNFRWDAFDSVVYNTGIVAATATGPVPIAPFASGFLPGQFTVTEFKIFINETFQTPAIWTINGTGVLFRVVGNTVDYHPDGFQTCSGSGAH